jgi:multiple sugar transport system permease protein
MSTAQETMPVAIARAPGGEYRARYFDLGGIVLTTFTIAFAALWAFPLYWATVTTLKPEHEVVRPYIELWPDTFTLEGYVFVIQNSNIEVWLLNSVVVATSVTLLVIAMGSACGYAISQLKFPGRRLLWWTILASFMVPIQALIVNHFILMWQVNALNTWAGIVLPQLIHPVVVIVYKQFFDSLPREYREAAVIDGASEYQLLFKVYLPMNWGVTTALAIVTFIIAWNAFLWPFLAATTEDKMTVTVGITAVQDAFGVYYARLLAGAVIAGLPVAVIYLIFQRRVTQAITLSAGIKG